MTPLLKLLRPYRNLFVVAMLALSLAAMFNSALTALVAPLMDQIMTDEPVQRESKVEAIFGFKDIMADIESMLEGTIFEKVDQGPDMTNPLPWALLVMIVFMGQALFDYVGTYTMGRVGLLVVVGLRRSMIEHVLLMPLTFYRRYNTGEILTRVNTDVLRIQNAISSKMGEMVKEIANCAAFTIMAFYLNWKMSLTLFVLVPLVGVPISIFTRKIRKNARHSQNFLGALTGHLKEVLVGIRIVKGFQKEGFESARLEEQNQSFLKYALRELQVVAVTTPVMSLIGMVIILGFIVYGSVVIQSGAVTKGEFLLYVLAVYQLYQPIKRIARANSEIQQAVGVLPRIQELLDCDNEILEPEQATRFPGYPVIQSVKLEKVGFDYGNEPVLRDIELEVKQGAVLALVGASGSGKSTLVNLLPRFYDVCSGAVTINGLDIREMSKADLRELIAVVTQDTILFDDTVHNNIAYGMTDVPRERVVQAAKQAFADGFIKELPQGYDTPIGESGGSLSGGQRQRLSIARAILKDAPLLVLDEATSALDTESEREVQAALENLMAAKTTFVIAHRLSTIRRAHHIVVMHEGRIRERGDHQSLLQQGGIYSKLVKMQEEGVNAL